LGKPAQATTMRVTDLAYSQVQKPISASSR